MKAPLEADILKQCLAWLQLHGVLAWRTNQGAMTGEYKGKRRFVRFSSMPGVSDILGVLPDGIFLACETKRPGRHPTPEQAAFLDRVNRQGGIGVCVHSLSELEAALRAEGVEF